jgi:hypothetical protein
MAYSLDGPNDGSSLAAQSDPRFLWSKAISIYEGEEDPFMAMEGGGDSIIETKSETGADAGTTIRFQVTSEFGDEGKQGDETFEDSDDYEEMLLGDFELTVDWLRHGTRWKKRGMEIMGIGGELKRHIPKLLGRWLGKAKSHSMQMTMLHKTNSANHFYTAGSQDSITMGDGLTYDEIVKGGAILKPLGGTPARIGRDSSGNPIWGATILATDNATYGLKLDPVYRQNLQNGFTRGGDNYLFSGGVANVDGHLIKEYVPKRGDIEGAVGSPLNPQALLGVAITGATTAVDIKGGGNATSAAKTKKKYFKYFPKFAYSWRAAQGSRTADTLSATSEVCWDLTALGEDGATTNVFYVRITNPPNATTDPGKWCIYECSANDGNILTTTARLGASDSGVRFQTVGAVTWDANKHTVTHGAGSLVTLCNASGVPLGATLVLYRQAAYRGYGSVRNNRVEDAKEGGFIQERYIESVFGQCLREDRVGNKPGIAVIKHAIHYPGIIDA